MNGNVTGLRSLAALAAVWLAICACWLERRSPPRGGSASRAAARPVPPPKADTPQVDRGMPVFDRIVSETLKARHIPGGALAIVKGGKLSLARGYGLADVKTQQPVTWDTLFSTASITKTITAAAVLRLVDQGKLSLDDSVYALLGKPLPLGRATLDPLVEKITLRQLLQHTGGWNSKYHSDVLRQTQKIARLTGEKSPLPAETVTRYGLSRPLDFAPGSESHYSNFGYFLVKRIVERAARQPYETYVRQQVLRPLGISDMRLEQLAPAYSAGEAASLPQRRAGTAGRPRADRRAGGKLAGHRRRPGPFRRRHEPTASKPLLSATARQEMFAVPPPPLGKRKSGTHVGPGWDVVRKGAEGLEYHKSGNMAGVRAHVEHVAADIDWVLLLNSDGTPDDQSTAAARLVEEIRQAIDATRQWPSRDLFSP